MSRIQLHDNAISAVTKMSEGNPGAMTAMMEILKITPKVDPSAFMGGLGAILLMDTFEIYGSDIYVLWSDICERDTVKMLAVLRATQLGFFDSKILKNASNRQDYSGKELVTVNELYQKVKERLPEFDAGSTVV